MKLSKPVSHWYGAVCFLIGLFTLFLLPFNAQAQLGCTAGVELDYVTGTVVFDNSGPKAPGAADGVMVVLYDDFGDEVAFAIVGDEGFDSGLQPATSGRFYLNAVDESFFPTCLPYGDYTLDFLTGSSPDVDLAGFYEFDFSPSTTFTIDNTPPGYFSSVEEIFDLSDGFNSFSPFPLTAAARSLDVQVRDADSEGAPLGTFPDGITVEAYFDVDPYYMSGVSSSSAGEEGKVYFPLEAGSEGDGPYTLGIASTDYGVLGFPEVSPGSGVTPVNLDVVAGDTALSLELVEIDQQPALPLEGEVYFIECSTHLPNDELLTFSTFIFNDGSNTPSNQVNFMVVAGEYFCVIDTPLGQKYFSETVPQSVSPRPVVLNEPTETITIQAIVSGSGASQVVSDECLSLSVFPLDEDSFGDGYFGGDLIDIESGNPVTADFNVITGVEYAASVWPCFDPDDPNSGFGGKYLIPFEEIFFTGGDTGPINFELIQLDASVTVVLQDQSGNRVKGFVDVYSPPAFNELGELDVRTTRRRAAPDINDPSLDHWNGGETTNGELTIGVLSGREYFINAFPDFDSDNPFISDKEVRREFVPGVNPRIIFTVIRADHTVTIDPGPAPAGTFLFMDCFAFNREGQGVYGFADSFSAITLGITGKKKKKDVVFWNVGCSVVFDTSGEDKFYIGSTLYEPNGDSGTIQLTLSEDRSYFNEQCFTLKNGEDELKTLQDNQTLVEVSKGTFGDNGVTELCANSGQGFSYSYEEFPASTWDLTFTKDDVEITSVDKPVRIWFPINLDRITALGATVDDLIGGSFNEQVKNWNRDAPATIEVRDGITYLIVSVNHFSLWGALVNLTESEQKATPTSPKVRGKKGKLVKFLWQAPANAEDDTIYELQYVKYNGKVKKWEAQGNNIFDFKKAKTKSGLTGTTAKLKLGNGTWKWRVRVKGGTNTAINSFKRKRRR